MAQEEEKKIELEKKIEIFEVKKKETAMIRMIDVAVWKKLILSEKLALNSYEIEKNGQIKPININNNFEDNCRKVEILNEDVCNYLININITQLGPDCFAFAPCQMIVIGALSTGILQPLLKEYKLIMNEDVMNYIVIFIANESVRQLLWNNSKKALHILNSHGGAKETFIVQAVQYLFGIKDYIPVGIAASWPPELGEEILGECGLGISSIIVPKPVPEDFYPTGSILDMDKETLEELLNSGKKEIHVVVLANINECLWNLLQSNHEIYKKEDKKDYLFIKNSWKKGQYWTVKKDSFMYEVLLGNIVSIPITALLLFHTKYVIDQLKVILETYDASPKEEVSLVNQERRGGDWGAHFLIRN